MTHRLLSFGHGYSARTLARRLLGEGWQVTGTTRSPAKAEELAAEGVEGLVWPGADLGPSIERATHVLISASPDSEGCPVLRQEGARIAAAPHLKWIGYLSTTGVYGDAAGGWVDEDTPPEPAGARGRARVEAERAWLDTGLPVHVFRLAGIYGPGRGPFEKIRAGTARRILKPGQVFGRIHVEDIATVLQASFAHPDPGRIYNVTDDQPARPQDVLSHAAGLLGLPAPPEVRFEDAEMTPMARSFYATSKRVRNDRIKEELGVTLAYPGYREGLGAILAAESG